MCVCLSVYNIMQIGLFYICYMYVGIMCVCVYVCERERVCVCVISHVLSISPIMVRKHLFKRHISKDNSSIASNVCHSVEWDSVESFC